MNNIKVIFLIFIALMLYVSAEAQNKISKSEAQKMQPNPPYPELFKTIGVELKDSDPEWIKMMYSSSPNFFKIVDAYESYYQNHPFEKNVHTQNYKQFYRLVSTGRYYDNTGKIFIDRTYNEIEVQAKRAAVQGNTQTLSGMGSNNTAAPWSPLAPIETFDENGNRKSEHVNVYCLAQSKTNPNILYAGTETGALFKTTDKAENWTEVGAGVLNYGAPIAIKIDPFNPDVVYVLYQYYLLKTTDGGTTWNVVVVNHTLSSQTYTQFINGRDFEIKPDDSNVLFLAGVQGLLQSLDGGTTWKRITSNRVSDVEFKSDDPNTIFFARRSSSTNTYMIYKTTDNFATNNGSEKWQGYFWPNGDYSVISEGAKIATTAADPNRVYVLLLGSEDTYQEDLNYIGVYRSDDAGETWTLPYDGDGDGVPDDEPGGPYDCWHWSMSTFGVCGGSYDQGFYNADIDVSDTDPDLLMVGMLNLFKSTDGGKTFIKHGGYLCDNCSPRYRHPDIQDILVQGNDVWVATDGGVDIYDTNLNFSDSKNKGITSCDFWGFDQGWNDDVVVGGRYHTGNMAYYDGYQNGRTLALGGGESATGFVNLGNNRVVYHDDIGGRLIPTTIPGPLTRELAPTIFPNKWGSRSGSEIVNDPRWFNHIYLGNQNILYKSLDYGQSYTILKQFGEAGHTVRGIEVSRKNPNLIFVAHHTGSSLKFWRSSDAGQNWTEISIPITTNAFSFSLNEQDELFISFDASGTNSNKVFKSTNLGTSWTNLTTAALSGYVILDTEVQEGTDGGVYVMSANKVFYRNNSMTDWVDYSAGLPVNFRLLEAKPFYKKGKLRLAGNRGVWERDFYEPSAPKAQPMVALTEVNCNRQIVQFDDYSVLDHTGATWNWSFPGASSVSSTTVRNPQVVYANTGTYDVTLTVTNALGTSTKTVSQMITVLPSRCSIDTMLRNAVQFTGSSDQYLTKSLSTPKSLTHFTFTAWIKPNGIQSNYSSVFFSTNTTNNTTISLDFKNGTNELGTHCGGLWWYNSGLIVPSGKWSFVALIYTPSKVTILLNDRTYEINQSFATHIMNSFDIGIHNRNGSRKYKGDIDEVHLYDRALTITELQQYRHLIRPDDTDANHIAYFQFNEFNQGLIYDSKGDYDLTVMNGPVLVPSTAPVGSGVSQMFNINAAGEYHFSTVGMKMNFNATVPSGNVAVTRLYVSPVNEKSNIPAEGNEYWIVDNFGTNQNFNGLTSLEISSQRNWSADIFSDIAAYVRSGSEFQNTDWGTAIPATNVTSPNVIHFGAGVLSNSSQLYIGRTSESATWTGSASTQWDLSANWNTGIVPVGTTNVVIPNVTNKPLIANGVNAQAKKVSIQSGASLRIDGSLTSPSGILLSDGGTILAGSSNYSGTVTVQKQISPQRGWRILHNPFTTGVSLSSLATNNSIHINTNVPANGITDTRLFNSSTGVWTNNSSDIPGGTSFALFIRGLKHEVNGINYVSGPSPFTMEMSGLLRNYPMAISPLVSTPKFAIIGNPLLAPVNSSALTNGDGVPYYRYQIATGNNPNQKRARSGSWIAEMSSSSSPVPVLGVIAYQPAGLTGYNVGLNDVNLSSSVNSGYLTTEPVNKYLMIDLLKESLLRDRVILRQHPLATSAPSDRMDLEKMTNEVTNLFLTPLQSKLSIDARKYWGDPIPMTITSDTGSYSIRIVENKLSSNLEVYLQDRYLNTEIRLLTSTTYNFIINSDSLSQGPNRFKIVFRGSDAVKSTQSTKLKVTVLGSVISSGSDVKFLVAGKRDLPLIYKIMDMNGMILKSGSILEGTQVIQTSYYPRGVYILQVQNGYETVSNKLLVQ